MTIACGIEVPEPVVLELPPGGERRRHGSVYAEVHGRGRPVVLVPGLGCGANVWGSLAIAMLGTGEHQVHALTLAGFAGTACVDPPLLPRWRSDLGEYILREHLERPIVIGHSLGAFLALGVAIDRGTAIGGVVALDGVPAIRGLVDPSIDLAAVAADHVRRHALHDDDASSQAAWWSSSLRAMMTAPDVADRLTASVVRSNWTAVGHAIAEILLADVRDEMTRLAAPVLAIGALGPYKSALLRGRHLAAFGSMFVDVPVRETVILDAARHFVMLDAPSRVHATILDFIRRRCA